MNELMAELQNEIMDAVLAVDEHPQDYLSLSNRLRLFALDLAEKALPAYEGMGQHDEDIDAGVLQASIGLVRRYLVTEAGGFQVEPFRASARAIEAIVVRAVVTETECQNSVLASASKQAAMTVRSAVRDHFSAELHTTSLQVLETVRSFILTQALHRAAAVNPDATLDNRQIMQACEDASDALGLEIGEALRAAVVPEQTPGSAYR